MSIGTRVVVAVAFQQVDRSPDAEAGTQCDNEGLKNGYCAVEKCHKCVPPCTLRPYGLMNSDFPSACAPANGQTYSQISNPNQKPGYVKGRLTAALIRIPTSYAFCLTKKSRKQRHQSRADQCHAAASHQLFHTKIGVKLCSMAGGGVSRNLWNFFRTAPAGTGQAVTCSTSGMGLRLK